jgi:hypothetical protein
VNWPFMKTITHKRILEQQKTNTDKIIDMEYDRALTDITQQLRNWLLDFNYTSFHASDNMLRPVIYAHISRALATFHNKENR